MSSERGLILYLIQLTDLDFSFVYDWTLTFTGASHLRSAWSETVHLTASSIRNVYFRSLYLIQLTDLDFSLCLRRDAYLYRSLTFDERLVWDWSLDCKLDPKRLFPIPLFDPVDWPRLFPLFTTGRLPLLEPHIWRALGLRLVTWSETFMSDRYMWSNWLT